MNFLRLHRKMLHLGLTTTAGAAICPCCGSSAERIHSRYDRCLADLPCAGVAVRLELQARKFFCDNPRCRQRIFTEGLPGLAARYSRKTMRLQEALQIISFALGGEAGARLSQQLAMTTSPDTLLRSIRRWVATPMTTPRVLGVDDWAKRRGHSYGTLLIDLEQRKLIDLLPDRSAETLTQWLRQHPGIEIISRDRGGNYAQAAQEGAPQALQVADRWHLLKNLGDAIERYLLQQNKVLREVAASLSSDLLSLQCSEDSVPMLWDIQLSSEQQLSAARRQRRLSRYEHVVALREQEYSVHDIARQVGVDEKTVRRYLRSDGFPEMATGYRCRSPLTPYQPYLQQRWGEGERNAAVLWRELKERGYRGDFRSIQRAVTSWRTATERRSMAGRQPTYSGEKSPRVPLPRQIVGVLIGCVENPNESVQAFVDKLVEMSPVMRTVQRLGQTFYQLVKERKESGFDTWLGEVNGSGISELKSFGRGLLQDEAAVRNGLSLEWSNGQTEGHVNKLKTLKRQMYGRASFDLLRQRLLQAA